MEPCNQTAIRRSSGRMTAFNETPIEDIARALIYIFNQPEDRKEALERFKKMYENEK
jgi:hypothetical protein